MTDRKEILLKAAHEILSKCNEAPYRQNALEVTTYYDGTECDGFCLMEDIATELGIDET